MSRLAIKGMTEGIYSSSPLDEVVYLILEAMDKGQKKINIVKKKEGTR